MAACCGGWLAHAATGWACSPAVSPVQFIGETVPADGQIDVAPNTGFVFHGVDAGLVGAGGGFALHSVSLVGPDGAGVEGRQLGRLGAALTWAPNAALAPNTTYDVTVRAGAAGDTAYVDEAGLMDEYTFSFTTGADLLPALAFDGELTVDFEVTEQDSFPPECVVPCGGGVIQPCESNGKYAVVNAVLHVPPVTGGHAVTGYRGVVDFTRSTPSGLAAEASRPPDGKLLATQYFDVAPDQPMDVVMRVSGDEPCFQVAISDSAGQSVTASVCAPEVSITGLVEERDAEIAARGDAPPQVDGSAPGSGTNAEADGVAQNQVGPRSTGACAFDARGTSTPLSARLLTLIGVVGVALRARRRQTSRARK